MKRFIVGQNRDQCSLLPESLDEYITDNNPVRVIDAFVDELDLMFLGFKTQPKKTGRPSYHPSVLLKLYIYGYLNRIQSSRKLEKETNRNIEIMWLTGKLSPDFKTIADFRKDNGKAIKGVCREFILICQNLQLFDESIVAIDGSKFKASNNRDRNFTQAKIKHRVKLIDETIEKYLTQIETADRQEKAVAKLTKQRLEEKITSLKEQVKKLNEIEVQLQSSEDKQVSLTDPDARSMKSRGAGIVGYNVQTAVDTKHHLILAHEVTNIGTDRSQLLNIATQAKEVISKSEIEAIADRGYFEGNQIKECEDAGISVYIPKCQTSGNQAKGLFGRRDFIYKPDCDEYECPAGERVIYRFSREEKGKLIKRYWSSSCVDCAMKSQCTTGKYRRISRWEHEEVLDIVDERLASHPEMMSLRRNTVEHPFGTIKVWMGYTHFQMRTLTHVATEMSLHVLAYNMKRVLKIVGIDGLLRAVRAA